MNILSTHQPARFDHKHQLEEPNGIYQHVNHSNIVQSNRAFQIVLDKVRNKNKTKPIHIDMSCSNLHHVPNTVICSDIESISLNRNLINGEVNLIKCIQQWPNVKTLKLSGNQIDSILIPHKCKLTKHFIRDSMGQRLRALHIAKNNLSTLPENLPVSLRVLNAGDNQIKILPRSLVNLHNLTDLWLQNNLLNTETIQPIRFLFSKRLCVLSLSHNPIDQFPTYTDNDLCGTISSSLSELYMDGTLIKDVPKDAFKSFSQLNILSIQQTQVDTLTEDIGNLSKLSILNLSNCIRMEELPKSIGRTMSLRRLEINDCKNISKLPMMSNFMHLRYIGMKNTRIKGVPVQWGANKRLQVDTDIMNATRQRLFIIYKHLQHLSHGTKNLVCMYLSSFIYVLKD